MSMAVRTFSISFSKSQQSREMPKFTLIFVFKPRPIPSGLRLVCRLLAGMTIVPSAMRCRSNSTSISSFAATISISEVMIPLRAASGCAMRTGHAANLNDFIHKNRLLLCLFALKLRYLIPILFFIVMVLFIFYKIVPVYAKDSLLYIQYTNILFY